MSHTDRNDRVAGDLLIDAVPVRVLFNVETLNLGLCGALAYLFVVTRTARRVEPKKASAE